MKTRIILLRHAQSVANAEERFTRDNHEPLTEHGEAQAIVASQRIVQIFPVDAIYSSPYTRAQQTAAPLSALVSREPAIVDCLYEQKFGEALHGKRYRDLDLPQSAMGAGRWSHRPEGGETLLEVAQRSGPALDRIVEAHRNQTIVVVSHGAVMAALRGYAVDGYEKVPVLTENASGFVLHAHDAGYEWGSELAECWSPKH